LKMHTSSKSTTPQSPPPLPLLILWKAKTTHAEDAVRSGRCVVAVQCN
jgi:hypothetical protein